MSVTKPDATKFDNDADSIADARPELYTLATSFNTIADEYNAGTLGASSTLDYGDADVTTGVTDGTTYTPTGGNNVQIYVVTDNNVTFTVDLQNYEPNQEVYVIVDNQSATGATINIDYDTVSNVAGPTPTNSGDARYFGVGIFGSTDSAGTKTYFRVLGSDITDTYE